MKKFNPYFLSGTDYCRHTDPETACVFRSNSEILDSDKNELLPDQDYCDGCRDCKLKDYIEDEPVVPIKPPQPSKVESVKPAGRRLAIIASFGLLLLFMLGGFFLYKSQIPEPEKITNQCQGYDLYEFVGGKPARLIEKNCKDCGFKEPVKVEPEPVPALITTVKKKFPKHTSICSGGFVVERLDENQDGKFESMTRTEVPCKD